MDIIEQAYHQFKTYKAPKTIDACTDCCLTKDQEAQLLNQSVSQLSFETMYAYNTAAKTEDPSLEEFKHFLPRFLDLTAQWNYLHHTTDLIFSRFNNYKDGDWSEQEVAILQAYAEELFSSGLQKYPLPEYEHLFEVLLSLSDMPISISPLFEQWSKADSTASLLHLDDVYSYYINASGDGLNIGKNRESFTKQFMEWLRSADTRQDFLSLIEHQLIDDCLSEDLSSRLSMLYECLR